MVHEVPWYCLLVPGNELKTNIKISYTSKKADTPIFGNDKKRAGTWQLLFSKIICSEMEFLDINLTKDLSLLLHAMHSPSTGVF